MCFCCPSRLFSFHRGRRDQRPSRITSSHVPRLPASSPSQFAYRPLTRSDEIRLLLLEPALDRDALLKGSLQHIKLGDYRGDLSNPYTALSYVWGDPSNPDTILLEDYQFGITANLGAALRDIRSTTRVFRLWADAICIDQKNIPERNQQVALMGDLYYKADNTIVYLGALTSGSEYILGQVPAGHTHLPVAYPVGIPFDEFGLLTSSLSQSQIEIVTAATKDLLAKPWFRRAWTFQEVVLSREPWIQCGTMRVRWSDLCRFLLPLLDAALITGNPPVRGFPPLQDPSEQDPLETLPSVGARHLAHMNQTRGDVHDSHNSGRTNLARILDYRQGSLATDPRDLIYANMGLHSDRDVVSKFITIDYNKTIRELFMEAGRYAIANFGWSDQVPPEILKSPLRSILPSWVPDWSAQISADRLEQERAMMSKLPSSTLEEEVIVIRRTKSSLEVDLVTSVLPSPASFPRAFISQVRALYDAPPLSTNPDIRVKANEARALWLEFTKSLTVEQYTQAPLANSHPAHWAESGTEVDRTSGVPSFYSALKGYFITGTYQDSKFRLARLRNNMAVIVDEDVRVGDRVVQPMGLFTTPNEGFDLIQAGGHRGGGWAIRHMDYSPHRFAELDAKVIDKLQANNSKLRLEELNLHLEASDYHLEHAHLIAYLSRVDQVPELSSVVDIYQETFSPVQNYVVIH
ncbi:heterokaryon incompatibility protein-domain-containing protein [Hypoxylon rubiginosum]|uniref:Heterokaryon incompatibility protein-domain-containing protein n=1 Tax=Hypoxylon rubiginosum TaxID=110542 RepID=A0ACB9YHP1_9PEZI|nr:heterokaryon incompatibility protein-domain-containing protein [Hypoxylon rubiginosum]